MSKNTLQDKLKASIQRPADTRARTARPAAAKKEAAPAAAPAAEKNPAPATAAPAPAAKPSQPKKSYFNDERVWPD